MQEDTCNGDGKSTAAIVEGGIVCCVDDLHQACTWASSRAWLDAGAGYGVDVFQKYLLLSQPPCPRPQHKLWLRQRLYTRPHQQQCHKGAKMPNGSLLRSWQPSPLPPSGMRLGPTHATKYPFPPVAQCIARHTQWIYPDSLCSRPSAPAHWIRFGGGGGGGRGGLKENNLVVVQLTTEIRGWQHLVSHQQQFIGH